MFRNVEAVFFWRYRKAAFAATYGRLPGTEYSKDFLQSPAEQYQSLMRFCPVKVRHLSR
jgi:hypothetical protein